jgi:hypothetical protein
MIGKAQNEKNGIKNAIPPHKIGDINVSPKS